jgi:integrase
MGQAERGEFEARPKLTKQPTTFLAAAVAYMRAGFPSQYVQAICNKLGETPLSHITQVTVDMLAAELYPTATPATRNRQVYTPISAILKRAGVKWEIERPAGWKGKKATSWLEPDRAFRLFEEADKIDMEFGLLCFHLTYTGMRLGEALSRPLSALILDRAYMYLPDSKTGEPRGCHLTPDLIARYRAQPARSMYEQTRNGLGEFTGPKPLEDGGVPFLERHPERKLFRFHDGGALRDMLKDAMAAAGLSFPRRQGGFHLFCHTYGSWMVQFGGLDAKGLTDTGRWADADSAWRYVHSVASEAAQRADLLPVPPRAKLLQTETQMKKPA